MAHTEILDIKGEPEQISYTTVRCSRLAILILLFGSEIGNDDFKQVQEAEAVCAGGNQQFDNCGRLSFPEADEGSELRA